MGKDYLNENQVKQILQIRNFRELSKDKIIEFVSLIPHMDKDVAISVINQFPAYADSAQIMVEQMNVLCDRLISDNADSIRSVTEAYLQILVTLQNRLLSQGISEKESNEISQKMISIADRIAAKDTENKQFLSELAKYGTLVLGGVVLIGAAILGVNIRESKIPLLHKA